ncbi:dihydrolipoyl dehydrogenase [Candidatus Blochmanniella vafra str. BVAF]|uniref:Dihydrolipoyl dehydrogenase n=1 Tax=Blochmanniella vafra (strain BVAF) TaxID=859654 RepID=E8Q5R2_BLOVB|nr:dihydrolipoyl dehydrogenase [Candidatus Blochmannia vafer]ADV33559.1 dihydrolipoyl dehydrogenase [Candidatus Blochmannia vafer str. BVAF]
MNIKIERTTILVIGAGPGGYSAAFRCSDLGMKTMIVERYKNLGGVCLNVGCIPSKSLLHIAKLINDNKNLSKYGILQQNPQIQLDLNKISLWKNNIINQLSRNLYSLAKAHNVNIVHGLGKFIDNHTLQIFNDQQEETLQVIFDYAIIAAGSHTLSFSSLPNDKRIWHSTDALQLQSIPETLLIVGAGAIGLEMATIYHALGSKVEILESQNKIIPILDQDIIKILSKNLYNKNIDCIINTKINSIYTQTDGIYVVMENNSDTTIKNTNKYDAILIAIGRAPNSNILNLQNAGINVNKYGFISVDKQMRTNVPNIFAIGDIIGHPMLAHKSIHEGYVAAEVISGKNYYFDAKIIPSIIYTNPEIAWVGYTEQTAQQTEEQIQYKSVALPWTALGKAITSNCTEGITKLVFDKTTHKIIGGSVIGTNASEIIGEIALAIEMGCDVEDITLTIHAHPTLHESIELAASIYYKSIKDFSL